MHLSIACMSRQPLAPGRGPGVCPYAPDLAGVAADVNVSIEPGTSAESELLSEQKARVMAVTMA
jgi:hypothetical protein